MKNKISRLVLYLVLFLLLILTICHCREDGLPVPPDAVWICHINMDDILNTSLGKTFLDGIYKIITNNTTGPGSGSFKTQLHESLGLESENIKQITTFSTAAYRIIDKASTGVIVKLKNKTADDSIRILKEKYASREIPYRETVYYYFDESNWDDFFYYPLEDILLHATGEKILKQMINSQSGNAAKLSAQKPLFALFNKHKADTISIMGHVPSIISGQHEMFNLIQTFSISLNIKDNRLLVDCGLQCPGQKEAADLTDILKKELALVKQKIPGESTETPDLLRLIPDPAAINLDNCTVRLSADYPENEIQALFDL